MSSLDLVEEMPGWEELLRGLSIAIECLLDESAESRDVQFPPVRDARWGVVFFAPYLCELRSAEAFSTDHSPHRLILTAWPGAAQRRARARSLDITDIW